MHTLYLDGESLGIKDVVEVARFGRKAALSDEAKKRVQESAEQVERFIEEERVIYGITTGFGKFSDVKISKEEISALQRNLILSHACGVGDYLKVDEVRALMLLRVNALSRGFSGIRLETLERLLYLLNQDILPLIPEKGSLGASGDLAPLAHMVLPLIGEGECFYGGIRRSAADVHEELGIDPIELYAKEGLALINGTQVMTAIGLLAYYDAVSLYEQGKVIYAMTLEALEGITDALDPRLHKLRPHAGQMQFAEDVLSILEGSRRVTRQGEKRVQDAYTLRCAPQVLGASWDALEYVGKKIEIEINAVTDNPIIFKEDQVAISGGNFHGQPMALAFDFLGIAVSEMANISERRIERLVNPALSGMEAFLTPKGGLHSGFMIAQYATAALVSENKVLAHPASVDSIPSSANQEDHVSMGTIAARKAKAILQNTRQVLAVEYLCAAQAIDLQDAKDDMARRTREAYDELRSRIPFMDEDRFLSPDMLKAADLLVAERLLEQ